MGDELPKKRAPQPEGAGRRAFDSELSRLARRLTVTDDDPKLAETSRLISRARDLAEAGDFIRAIRVLGNVEVRVDEAAPGGFAEGVRPEEVEQALGDLRRAIAKAPPSDVRDEAKLLCQAARMEASDRRWAAAWALIDEADQRLSEGYRATPGA